MIAARPSDVSFHVDFRFDSPREIRPIECDLHQNAAPRRATSRPRTSQAKSRLTDASSDIPTSDSDNDGDQEDTDVDEADTDDPDAADADADVLPNPTFRPGAPDDSTGRRNNTWATRLAALADVQLHTSGAYQVNCECCPTSLSEITGLYRCVDCRASMCAECHNKRHLIGNGGAFHRFKVWDWREIGWVQSNAHRTLTPTFCKYYCDGDGSNCPLQYNLIECVQLGVQGTRGNHLLQLQ